MKGMSKIEKLVAAIVLMVVRSLTLYLGTGALIFDVLEMSDEPGVIVLVITTVVIIYFEVKNTVFKCINIVKG